MVAFEHQSLGNRGQSNRELSWERIVFELTVVAAAGRWLLIDDDEGEVGDFASQAEALAAAREYQTYVDDEPRHVLIQDHAGEWDEAVVDPPPLQ